MTHPSEESDLESRMEQLEQEILEAGEAGKFAAAGQKEKELERLRIERVKQKLLPQDDPDKKIEILHGEITKCFKKRKWQEAQSLQQMLDETKLQVKFSKISTEIQEQQELHRKKSAESSVGGPTYGHLTVLQAEPLVWYDGNEFHKYVPLPNIQNEKKAIEDALNQAKENGSLIDVSFEAATTTRFAALLADPENRILHYSGQVIDDQLVTEKWGARHLLPVEVLKGMVSAGCGTSLDFVFVAAGHSRTVGQAFVDAGVSHVVCCQQDESLDDAAAVEFIRTFYREVGCGHTLTQAFKAAREAARTGPTDRDSKFLLLPEKEGESHGVRLFPASPVANRPPSSFLNHPSVGKPPLPPISPFIGRELDMYRVLERLRHSRFINITGMYGVGKYRLAYELSEYICRRKDAFSYEEIYWLSSPVDKSGGDKAGGWLTEVMEAIADDTVPVENKLIWQSNELNAELLRDRCVLMFIDARDISSKLALTKLRLFLGALFWNTSRVYVVLISNPGEHMASKVIPDDSRVELGPLDMWSTVLLFGNVCPYISQGLAPGVCTPNDLAELLVPSSQAKATQKTTAMSKRTKDIFGVVGEGSPYYILQTAREMSESSYLELVRMGKRQEFQRKNYDTRHTLDQELARIATLLKEAEKGSDFLQASQLEKDKRELKELQNEFPTLEELRKTEMETRSRLNDAVSTGDAATATELLRRLSECGDKIKCELEAAVQAVSNPDSNLEQSVSFYEEGISPALVSYTVQRDFSFTLEVAQLPVTEFSHSNPRAAAIVCATNEGCVPVDGSVSGAVMAAGGDALEKAVDKLDYKEKTHWKEVRCPTGEARMVGPSETDSYGKLNVSWVIFAVGPTYTKTDPKDALKQKDTILRSVYSLSLELAKRERLEAVAFSLISAGHRAGHDLRRPLRIALEVIAESGYEGLKKVQLCAFLNREAVILNDVALEMGLTPLSVSPSVAVRANAQSDKEERLSTQTESKATDVASQSAIRTSAIDEPGSELHKKGDEDTTSEPPRNSWSDPKLHNKPSYPLRNMHIALKLEDFDKDTVLDNVSSCFKTLSLHAKCFNDPASAVLLTWELVEMRIFFWLDPTCGEIIVEVQRLRGDFIVFEKYASHILDAATGKLNASGSKFALIDNIDIEALEKADDVLQKVAPRSQEETIAGFLDAMEDTQRLFNSDRMDAITSGMDSLGVLADPRQTGVDTSVFTSRAVLLGVYPEEKAGLALEGLDSIRRMVVFAIVQQGSICPEGSEISDGVPGHSPLEIQGPEGFLLNRSLTVLAHVMEALVFVRKKYFANTRIEQRSVASVADHFLRYAKEVSSADLISVLVLLLGRARQDPHNACLAAVCLRLFYSASKTSLEGILKSDAVEQAEIARKYGVLSHAQLEVETDRFLNVVVGKGE